MRGLKSKPRVARFRAKTLGGIERNTTERSSSLLRKTAVPSRNRANQRTRLRDDVENLPQELMS